MRKQGPFQRCPKHWPLERRIAQYTERDPVSGCLIWKGRPTRMGYGRLNYQSKLHYAHRVTWTLRNGPIPPGMILCHRCDERRCVEPDHLFLGTHGDNMADLKAKLLLRSNARASDDATIRIIYRGIELVGPVKVVAFDPRVRAAHEQSLPPSTSEKEQS